MNNNKLRKSSTDKAITGVCGGIAEFFGVSSIAVRLIFVFLPGSLPIYIILVYFLPEIPPSL
ncbi:PspC domain-containing protein [Halalkalibacillus sediminis]|uniref:PspC domain-containing protein n=1 Tax=Halalkalibacillus sediminis TaxID=2018042 RepID=A0A2I0QQW2_9BACI|nr:PspC domain-containing protein [Halalkalibacillus sediminis]PKR76708.1 PspC domain-containing protein [Halalkalibacillus sediminis]